jgi:hypothetical protein
MSDDDNVFKLRPVPPVKDDRVPADDALSQFAELMGQMEAEYGEVEVVAVALIPEIGVALCGNSETGNDGMMTMLEIGKTAIVMEYLNGVDGSDEDETIH